MAQSEWTELPARHERGKRDCSSSGRKQMREAWVCRLDKGRAEGQGGRNGGPDGHHVLDFVLL
jgi:hypothetical protein